MALLTKQALLQRVEEGYRADGWNVLYISAPNEHPARYRVYRDDMAFNVRVYIWNVSHGGGAARSTAEYRIQITGLGGNQFLPEPDGKTLILGWSEDEQVLAGFDYRRHAGALGNSPSLQIGLAALKSASTQGFAAHTKATGEMAVAFKPEFIGNYTRHLEALHDTGTVPAEAEILARVAAKPESVPEAEIATAVAATRQYAITSTRRALRAIDFSDRVLKAYGHACAICGIQLKLLEAAHIVPVSEPTSTDETCNGIALCALHHKAYDKSLITFDVTFKIQVNETRALELKELKLHGRLKQFRGDLFATIAIPGNKADQPRADYVKKANALRGWPA